MNKFSLIQKLNSPLPKRVEESSIKYQSYELDVSGNTVLVKIPLRETTNFETHITELTEKINNRHVTQILRKFRGIRG